MSLILPPFNQIEFKDPSTSPWFLASVIIEELPFSKKVIILKNFINNHSENYFISKEDPFYISKIDDYRDSIKELKKSFDSALELGDQRNQLVHSYYIKQDKKFYSIRSKVNDKNKIKQEEYSESTLKDLCNSAKETFHKVHEKSQYLSFLRSENLKFIINNKK